MIDTHLVRIPVLPFSLQFTYSIGNAVAGGDKRRRERRRIEEEEEGMKKEKQIEEEEKEECRVGNSQKLG